MKPEKVESELKELRRIKTRIDELSKIAFQIERLSTEKTKRIPAGHWRFYRVRDDVLRCSEGADIQKVVDLCNHWVQGEKKEPETFRCSTEILTDGGRPIYIPGQYLNPITALQAEEAKLTPKFLRKWFDKSDEHINVGTKIIPKPRYFPKGLGHRIEFAFKPAYLLEIAHPNASVQSERSRLLRIMDEKHGYERLEGGGRRRDGDELDRAKLLRKAHLRDADREIMEMGE